MKYDSVSDQLVANLGEKKIHGIASRNHRDIKSLYPKPSCGFLTYHLLRFIMVIYKMWCH